MQFTDRFVDLVGDGIDVAIRPGRIADLNHRADSNYRAVKSGELVSWQMASPAVVDAWSNPTEPSMVGTMRCIALWSLPRPGSLTLECRDGSKQTVCSDNPCLTNAAITCRSAVLAGRCVALLTDFFIARDIAARRLVRLLVFS